MARKKRMSRNKRLALVMTIIILVVLVAPQFIRYYMNVTEAKQAAQQEKDYLAKIARQQRLEGDNSADKLPVTTHWDLNAAGNMKVVVSSRVMKDRKSVV